VAEAVVTMHALEVAGTGDEKQMGPILTRLGQHARLLIEHDLRIRTQRISAIERKANQLVASSYGPVWWSNGVTRRGLYTPDRRELRDLIDYIRQVEAVAQLGQQYAWKIGRSGESWEPIISDCERIVAEARNVLDAE
jgi:hypothetical protein